eukprot:XP_014003443.1 PREDICTED: adenosine deaminase CECR1-A-like isoform X2 [Salmo salar]
MHRHTSWMGAHMTVPGTSRPIRTRPGHLCQNTQTSWELGSSSLGTGGRPLWYFEEALSLPGERRVNHPCFHAGETDEDNTDMDGSLLDALLINASCTGHGFSLLRHPVAKELSRKRGVVLKALEGPQGFPTSHIETLKELAMNSIRYSSVSTAEGESLDLVAKKMGNVCLRELTIQTCLGRGLGQRSGHLDADCYITSDLEPVACAP